MKRLTTMLSMVLLLVTGAAADSSVRVDNATFNFGKTTQRAKMIHTFWVKATGSKPVRITRVIPGCGCTKMPLPDSVITPGDSLPLTIIFDSKSFRDNIVKRPYFKTDSDDEPHFVKIYAEALVKPDEAMPLVIQPPKVDVSQFGDKVRRKAIFQIINKTDQEYTIKEIGNGRLSFDLNLPKKIKPQDTLTATIMVRKDKVDTDFAESITFEIDDDFSTHYTVPVRRFVRESRQAGK